MPRPKKSKDEKFLDGRHPRPAVTDVLRMEGQPFVPDHLDDDAQQCMEHITSLFKTRRLSTADTYLLTVFACAWSWHKRAIHAMSDPSFEVVGTGSTGRGEILNPWFKIMKEMSTIMLACSPKLYLSPADRAALMQPDQERSKFDGLTEPIALSSFSSVSPSHQE